ncbi:MAG: (2E,6E)-farnesyl diphosphate synthase [Gammaproteobacteria bacterium]
MAIEARLEALSARVERALDVWLPPEQLQPANLHKAMRYAALGGGKRMRPALVYATGQALGSPLDSLDGVACAVELIHAYSLIHDDLPAMDDDELRRGMPSCHKAFDEATAILAGDAMQALAFYILAHDPGIAVDPAVRVEMVESLAQASGSRGMAGGQAIDLASVGARLDIAQLEGMHIHKTGALIRASVMMAAAGCRDADALALNDLDHFAKCIGLAFQIRDDILDVEGDTAILGKTQGADHARDKPTYPALLGLEQAKARAHDLHDDALASLARFDERADLLRDIARYIVMRIK